VYYINIKPYIHDLPFQELLNRFNKSNILSSEIVDRSDFNKKMLEQFKDYNFEITEKNTEEYNIDKILSKKIMIHLQDFFKMSLSNNLSNKTYKKTNKNYKINKSNKMNKSNKNKTKKNQRNIEI
jgi:hypothetical protein